MTRANNWPNPSRSEWLSSVGLSYSTAQNQLRHSFSLMHAQKEEPNWETYDISSSSWFVDNGPPCEKRSGSR